MSKNYLKKLLFNSKSKRIIHFETAAAVAQICKHFPFLMEPAQNSALRPLYLH